VSYPGRFCLHPEQIGLLPFLGRTVISSIGVISAEFRFGEEHFSKTKDLKSNVEFSIVIKRILACFLLVVTFFVVENKRAL
jgi:hypothetical protein